GREAFESLSAELQHVVRTACFAENSFLLAEFNTRNHEALQTLIDEHGVDVRRFPDDVLDTLQGHSIEVLEELAASDPMVERIYESISAYRAAIEPWLEISAPFTLPMDERG
ncbi:MAG: hypothetical protein ACR2QQ_14525, partial [Gammaproteobacteria bacterium]